MEALSFCKHQRFLGNQHLDYVETNLRIYIKEILHNPDNITTIVTSQGVIVGIQENQGWQETKGRWELWTLDNKLLRLVKSWNKKAVLSVYG